LIKKTNIKVLFISESGDSFLAISLWTEGSFLVSNSALANISVESKQLKTENV
jgi:hypothetical protein